MRKEGFTLVELMIVVSILGILAAIVLPTFQGNTAEAKVSSAKTNLQVLRSQIEMYKMQHNGYPPGYVNGSGVSNLYVAPQLEGTTDVAGNPSGTKQTSASYPLGPYLTKVPVNPFNGLSAISYIDDPSSLPATAIGETYGWYYHRESGTIYLNYPGTDAEGVAYIDY